MVPMVLHWLPAAWREANVLENHIGLYQNRLVWGGESGEYETLCQYLTMHGRALTSTWKGEIPAFVRQDKNLSFPSCFHSLLASCTTRSLSLSLLCFLLPLSHTFLLLPSIPVRSRAHLCQKLQYSLGAGAVSLLPACSTQPSVNIIWAHSCTCFKCLCACQGPAFQSGVCDIFVLILGIRRSLTVSLLPRGQSSQGALFPDWPFTARSPLGWHLPISCKGISPGVVDQDHWSSHFQQLVVHQPLWNHPYHPTNFQLKAKSELSAMKCPPCLAITVCKDIHRNKQKPCS